MADPSPLVNSLGRGATSIHLQKPSRVKNKSAADVQITAEQIIREARSLQEQEIRAPKQKITDPEELADYRLTKRKEFEDTIRRVRWNAGAWTKYAAWEEAQGDLPRARSVYERALDVEYRSPALWMRYAEMEMKARNVNTARNVWDRAVSLLPRHDVLWYKYIHMEEVLGAVPAARQLFDRWLAWEPDHPAWAAYVKLELRYGEVGNARAVFERYVACHPVPKAWLRYAKFEAASAGDRARCRQVYERAVGALEGEGGAEEVFLGFAQFEALCKEWDRARAIYRYALDRLPKRASGGVMAAYAAFERQHGDRGAVEAVVLAQRRAAHEARIAAHPFDYDAWFDLLRGLEEGGDAGAVREGYERAIAHTPPHDPADPKRPWRRYVYLWLKYALWEEVDARCPERARAVHAAALRAVPHTRFTFAKLWVAAAQAELRAGDLGGARRLLGRALGVCPKAKLFRFYIETELQLGCVDRARILYGKLLEWRPEAAASWARFAQMERSLGETERGSALFDLGLSQPELDAPEVLWKAAIDAAVADGDRPAARALYERLLARTQHLRVWLSFAAFEAAPLPGAPGDGDGFAAGGEEGEGDEAPAARAARARAVYARADAALRAAAAEDKEPRVLLLEAWRAAEASAGSAQGVRDVEARMPRRVKRRRALQADDGQPTGGVEEYYDFIFPEEGREGGANLKILEAARRWKEAQQARAADEAAAAARLQGEGGGEEEEEGEGEGEPVAGGEPRGAGRGKVGEGGEGGRGGGDGDAAPREEDE